MAGSGGNRGSPGGQVKYHKGGIYSRYNERDGQTYYFIRYMLPDGRRKKEKVGTRKQDAKDLLEQRRTEIRLGTYKDPSERAAEQVSFAEFADRFMKDYASRRRSDHYEQNLAPMKKFFSQRPLREITRADLDGFAKWRGEKVGPSTLRKNLTALGTVFKMAVRWGVLEASPAVDLDKPSEPHHKTRYLSHAEWLQLQEKAPPWLRPILHLALAQGLRLKEAAILRWDDIDRQGGLLYVPEDCKSGRADPIPLTEEGRKVLRNHPRRVRCPYVFADSTGVPYTSEGARIRISKVTKTAMLTAGIQGATFHTLRHTTASWMVQRNVPLANVQKFMRHRNVQTTLRYAHLMPEHLGDTVAALDAALRGGPNSAPTHEGPSAVAEASDVITSAKAS